MIGKHRQSILMSKLVAFNYKKISALKERVKRLGNDKSTDIKLKEQAEKRHFKYIIPYNSKLKLLWDTLVILISLAVTLMNSLCLSFGAPFFRTTGFIAINLITDLLLLADMVIIFRTSKLNIDSGEEIYDPKILATKYIFSINFWIDLLSIIPFEIMSNQDLLLLFSMLKISRIGRISKIIESLDAVSKTKTVRLFLD
jgi:hypothetical protein